MKDYKSFLSEMDNYRSRSLSDRKDDRKGPYERGLEKKRMQKQDDDKRHDAYERKMAKAAEREATSEKLQKTKYKRLAAAEPVNVKDVVRQRVKDLNKKTAGKSPEESKKIRTAARTPLGRAKGYAGAAVGARVKKEKERLKTDPVGQVKKYASGVRGAAKATARALASKSGSIGTTSGSDSTERGVRYQ